MKGREFGGLSVLILSLEFTQMAWVRTRDCAVQFPGHMRAWPRRERGVRALLWQLLRILSCYNTAKPFQIAWRIFCRVNTVCFIQCRHSRPARDKLLARILLATYAKIKSIYISIAKNGIHGGLPGPTYCLNVNFWKAVITR